MHVRHLYLSPVHVYAGHHGRPPGTEAMQEVDSVECVTGNGLRGDRYFNHKPDYKGQVTFFELETHQRLCASFGMTDRGPDVYRRNVVVSDCDLNALIGREFEIQGVRFFGVEEAKPCYWMNTAFAAGAEAALKGHGGLRARILSDGTLHRES